MLSPRNSLVIPNQCGLFSRMKRFHLHLVSDSTGETVITLARAAVSQGG